MCIYRKIAVRRVLRTLLRLHMAKCFQVRYANLWVQRKSMITHLYYWVSGGKSQQFAKSRGHPPVVFYDLSFYVRSFARFDDFTGQIADIDLSTWSKNVKKCKFSKFSKLISELFLKFIDIKFTARRVLRTPLCLHMAECFQVKYANDAKHSPLALNMQIFGFNVNLWSRTFAIGFLGVNLTNSQNQGNVPL